MAVINGERAKESGDHDNITMPRVDVCLQLEVGLRTRKQEKRLTHRMTTFNSANKIIPGQKIWCYKRINDAIG